MWEQQFPDSLIGLSCATSADAPGWCYMRPAIAYRCNVAGLPPARSAADCHDRVSKAHDFEKAAMAAREKGERAPDEPMDESSKIKMDACFAPNIPDDQAGPLRAGAKPKGKKKTGPTAQDVDDSCVPPEGPDPAPPGFEWNGCGGVLTTKLEVQRAQKHLAVCQAAGQRLPQCCAMTPDPASLNEKQRQAYDQIDFACRDHQLTTAILYGDAGTGKTVLSRQLAALLGARFGSTSVLCLAPTGVAAKNLGGSTVHSKFQLSYTGSRDQKRKKTSKKRVHPAGAAADGAAADGAAADDVAAAAAADAADADADAETVGSKGAMNKLALLSDSGRMRFQKDWEGISYVLIDEAFMMESEVFEDLQTQCRRYYKFDEATPWDNTKPFGGKLGVVLIGDPQQLPPVCGSALASQGGNRGHASHAAILEHGETLHLTQQMRQNTGDGIVPLLGRMKRGVWDDAAAAHADAKCLNDNCGPGSPGYGAACHDPRRTHLCATNKEVAAHNFTMHSKLQWLTGQPCLRLRQARRGKHMVGGVAREFWHQRGAPCLITRNQWVEGGVTNGTRGDVGRWMGLRWGTEGGGQRLVAAAGCHAHVGEGGCSGLRVICPSSRWVQARAHHADWHVRVGRQIQV